jgi:nitrate reductase cytochrome c-type subunit
MSRIKAFADWSNTMRKRRWFLAGALLLSGTLLFACGMAEKRYTLPDQHPEIDTKGGADCLECHEQEDGTIVFANFTHTPNWAQTHRFRTYQNEAVCSMCHRQSFCNECHTTRVELKPSIFRQADTYRKMPHRGDYLSRHRIDARIDPTACFRCHGNPKSSQTCAPCHG